MYSESVLLECREVGKRIRRERLHRQLSLNDVATRMGSHPCTISQLENGIKHPKTPTLIRVAEAIGCFPSDFWLD